MTKIKISADQSKLLTDHGTMVTLDNGDTFYCLSNWFKKDGELWEILEFDQLPEELIEAIKKQRE